MRVVRYKEGKVGLEKHASGRNRIAIVDEPGRKWVHIVLFGQTGILERRKVLLTEQQFMTDIESRPRIQLTPLQSTAKLWLKSRKHLTKEVKSILRRAAE